MRMYEDYNVTLKWFRPDIGRGKTFNVKNVARSICCIVGDVDHKKYMPRAYSIIRTSLHKKEIFLFQDGSESQKRYAFERPT